MEETGRKRALYAVRQVGNGVSRMIMPNLILFYFLGILALVAQFGSQELLPIYDFAGDFIVNLLLPLLIAFTGGYSLAGQRGGVVACLALVGALAVPQAAVIVLALILGPLSGGLVKWLDEVTKRRTPQGFEMLFRNLSAGLVGLLLCLGTYYGLVPVIDLLVQQVESFVGWLVSKRLLPLIHIIVEPCKIFFLNNALNHGLFTPIGLEQTKLTGTSLLFLIEANPGPGAGVLLAMTMCY